MTAFPKPQTPRDRKYLAWLRQQPCVFCDRPPPSEASHHGRHGIALKPSDHEALPACTRCHRRHHAKGSPLAMYDAWSQDDRRDLYATLAAEHRQRYLQEAA